MHTRELGALAEDIAASYLRLTGHEVLARGYVFRGKELDIVARAGGRILFVEVKFRRTAARGLPREAVDARKVRHIVFAAQGFLAERRLGSPACRFDVVEVTIEPGGLALRVLHIPGAFGLNW
ncbi:MAG: YraN family protein [Candidatus Eisenbacteria bacterium]|nr:YraN family protein [Candidatus Eisenbacteria bacterium]